MIRLVQESDVEDLSTGRVRRGGVCEKTLGVVDVGSNTVHLLVEHTDGRHITPLLDKSEGLGLGGDVDDDGVLSDEKLAELIATLREYQAAARMPVWMWPTSICSPPTRSGRP